MLARINVTVTEIKTALLRASLEPSRNMEAPAHVGVVSSGSGQEGYVSVVNEISSREEGSLAYSWIGAAFCGYTMFRGELSSQRQRDAVLNFKGAIGGEMPCSFARRRLGGGVRDS
jgi:hypothetical protein